jgi:hypothetical protein
MAHGDLDDLGKEMIAYPVSGVLCAFRAMRATRKGDHISFTALDTHGGFRSTADRNDGIQKAIERGFVVEGPAAGRLTLTETGADHIPFLP